MSGNNVPTSSTPGLQDRNVSRRDIPDVADGQRSLVDEPKLPSQCVLSKAVALTHEGIVGSPDRSRVGDDDRDTIRMEAPGDPLGNSL